MNNDIVRNALLAKLEDLERTLHARVPDANSALEAIEDLYQRGWFTYVDFTVIRVGLKQRDLIDDPALYTYVDGPLQLVREAFESLAFSRR